MSTSSPATRTAPAGVCRRLALLLLATAVVAGCARLPRIDPSGERFLIFPGQQPPTAFGQPATGFGAPGAFLSPPGNVTAPPAFGQGRASGPLGLGVLGSGGALDRVVNGPTIVGPAVGVPQVGAPVAAPATGLLATGPAATGPVAPRLAGALGIDERVSGDRVVITPQRVLAPVGSEVVLRAGVCGEDGFLRTNRRIDWLLDDRGTGEFVQVGEEGEFDIGRLLKRPSKIDNNYAVGFTSPFHTCLRRGNADPSDDLQVRPGDAWITVTSAAEGTSYITAAAKSVDNWDTRRASTTIYWVDAQWEFPPSATVAPGQPHTLTTTVTRQSDGAPIAGWIVRYEVQDPAAARLGYDAGEASEVRTDAQGRAAIEVTPTDAGAGSTTVNMTVVRPAQTGAAASPRLDVGRGAATITWADGAPAATPTPSLPPIGPTPPAAPGQPDFVPPDAGGPIAPPPIETGRPQLEVTIRQLTPPPIRVGDIVQFDILVVNRGDAPARNLVILDQFDTGLANEGDIDGKNEVDTDQMRDLGPGDSDRLPIAFDVLQAGRLSHRVTVSADGPPGQPRIEAFDQASFTAEPVAPAAPTLRAEVDGPAVGDVRGGPVLFVASVENVGDTPATNVRLTLRYPPELSPIGREPEVPGVETVRTLPDGYEWTLPRLDPEQKTRQFRLECDCIREALAARVLLEVTADGGGDQLDEAVIEIRPEPPAGPGGGPGGGAPLGPAGPESPLQISVLETANPTTVGRPLQLNVLVNNAGDTPQTNVEIQVLMPVQLNPRLDQIVSPTAGTPRENRSITFAPIARLEPRQEARLLIPVDAVLQGVGRVTVNARSGENPAAATQTRDIRVDAN